MELILIQKKILVLRNQRVMLDFHLAEFYDVETRALKQAVKRNSFRFPADFMFELTEKEIDMVVSQNVIPSRSFLGGAKPYAFTEHGVSMLSSILKGRRAVEVNIAIIRAFIFLKQYSNDLKTLQKSIEEIESKFNRKIENINEVIDYLLAKPEPTKIKPRKKIGFKIYKQKQKKQ